MAGGKTRQANGGAAASRRQVTTFSTLRQGPGLQRREVNEVVEILTAEDPKRKHFVAGFERQAQQAELEKYLPPNIYRHFSTLFRDTFPEMNSAESRQVLREFLQNIPLPGPSEQQIYQQLRVSYLQQLLDSLQHAPESAVVRQEQEQIVAVSNLLQEALEQLQANPGQTPTGFEERITDHLELLRQAPGGRSKSLPRQPGPNADRDRLYEALEHGLYATKNILDLRPRSASEVTVVKYLSDFSVKLAGREPEYRPLYVDNFVESVPEPAALKRYWQNFVAACQQEWSGSLSA